MNDDKYRAAVRKAVERRNEAKALMEEFLRTNAEYQGLRRAFRKADDAYGRALIAQIRFRERGK